MKLGRVIGTLVSTVKVDGMQGLKLMVLRPLTTSLEPAGAPIIATDASGALGYGQADVGCLVTWEASREAALLHHPRFVPVDAAIVGIIDQYATSTDPADGDP